MPDRQPEPWQTDAAAPFLTIETPRGDVELWALGEDGFGSPLRGLQVGSLEWRFQLQAAAN